MKAVHRNYDRDMQALIAGLSPDAPPRLLLQCCCGPCSSAVLLRLVPHFDITVWFYNPNIDPPAEYEKRRETLRRLCALPDYAARLRWLDAPYDPARFADAARGLEAEPEGGRRCTACFALRLGETARQAADGGFDYFGTTLSVSPHKNAAELNAVGLSLERPGGPRFLPADFKKRGGFQLSLEQSRRYALYRQSYCGCAFSRQSTK